MKSVVGILYICTGKYTVFWDGFFESCEKHFFPSLEKRYFVFTDADSVRHEDTGRVVRIFQENLGWPGNTLYRFRMFQRARSIFDGCDYLFFLNANMLFLKPIPADLLPTQKDGFLLGVKHPGYFDKAPEEFTYERDPRSTAAIAPGLGRFYYMGGFNGGRTREFLTLVDTCAENIEKDDQQGLVAQWHDESHLNRYFLDHPPKTLPPAYGYPEGAALPFDPLVIIQNKEKFGGHAALRNEKSTAGVHFTGSLGHQLFQLALYRHLMKTLAVERVLAFSGDDLLRQLRSVVSFPIELGTSEMFTLAGVPANADCIDSLEPQDCLNRVFQGTWRLRPSLEQFCHSSMELLDLATIQKEGGVTPEENHVAIHLFDDGCFRLAGRKGKRFYREAIRNLRSRIPEARFVVFTSANRSLLDLIPQDLEPEAVNVTDGLSMLSLAALYRHHITDGSDTSWWILMLARPRFSVQAHFWGTSTVWNLVRRAVGVERITVLPSVLLLTKHVLKNLRQALSRIGTS